MNHGPTATADGSDDEPRARLARLIADRRRELGMSATEAAERAGVARNTWATAESGDRTVRQQNFAGIERALAWTTGSVAKVLDGGAPETDFIIHPEGGPTVLVEVKHHRSPEEFDLKAEIDRISGLPISASTRLILVQRVLDLFQEAQLERDDARAPQ